MMFSKPSISKKSVTLVVTLCIIALCYAFYFLVYIEKNESELDSKIYRRLERVASNILEKSVVWNRNASGLKQEIDRLNKDSAPNGTDNDILEKKIKEKIKKSGNEGFTYTFPNENGAVKTKDKKQLYYPDNLSFNLDDFLQSVLKYDIIDGYVLVRNDTIALQTLSNKSLNEASIFNDTIGEFTIANQVYKRFDHTFEFNKDEDWLIIGLVNKSKYINATKSISLWVIINFFLFILVIIVGLPFLKLVFMNPIERLFRTNVCFSGVSFILGVPLIILFLLVLQNYFIHENEEISDNLNKLSSKVKDNFGEELRSSLVRINNIEDNLEGFSKTDETLILNGKEDDGLNIILKQEGSASTEKNENNVFIAADTGQIITDYDKQLNELFWMDSDGNLRIRISKKETDVVSVVSVEIREPGANLKGRDYFSEISNERGYRYQGVSGKDSIVVDSIFIQSIYSFRSGKPEVAVSKPSHIKLDDEVLTVAAITSRFEKVMFPILPLGYSYCIIDKDGNVLIHSNTTKNLQENLIEESDKSHELHSYLVSGHLGFTNIDYNNKNHKILLDKIGGEETPLYLVLMYNLESSRAKISEIWSVSLILFLIALALLAITVLIYYLMTTQKRKLLIKDFFFEWLTPNENDVFKYRKMSIINVILILVVLIYFCFNTHDIFGPQLVILVLIPTISFVFTYYKLNDRGKKQYLNKFIVGLVFIGLLVLALSFVLNTKNFLKTLLFISCIIIIHSTVFIELKSKVTNKLKIDRDFPSSYAFFLLSWLTFSSLLPVVLIFSNYSKIEHKIWEAYSEIKYKEESHTKRVNNPEIHFEDYALNTLEKVADSSDSKTIKYEQLISVIRPEYNLMITENNSLIHKINNQTSNTENKASSFLFPLSFTLVALLFLFLLYQLIIFCIYKIYGLDYKLLKPFDFKELKEKITEVIINDKRNAIVVGVPGASKITFLSSISKKYDIIDFRSQEYFYSKDGKYYLKALNMEYLKSFSGDFIILDNFHFDNDDNMKNDIKLAFLKKVKSFQIPLVIVSELDPADIIDFHYRSIIDESTGIIDNDVLKNHQNRKENWRQLLADFIEFYLPLKNNKNLIDYRTYKEELRHGKYLQKLSRNIINNQRGKLRQTEYGIGENEILSIQKHANSYYYGLWNSLSRKEKFVVYDLAYDQFVNTSNTTTINRLIDKGIVIFDNKLRLMNQSFANFVLTIVNDGEVIEMNKEVRKKGKWGNIKQVIILVVIALIILIGLGQPDFLKNINAVVVTIAGIVSVIPSILGAISLGKKS